MRSEQEMFSLILRTAKEDERIRAVYMNGSRTNPNAPRDIFQDYDIVYVVKETRSFREDRGWIDRFGKRLFMQYPEESPFFPSDVENCYGWLIQLADGNRLDLHVQTVPYAVREIRKDRLCKILLDKDGLLPAMPAPTDEDYWIKRPTEAEFLAVCNEFWWCLNNVAKGLWRREIPYVQDQLNQIIRPELIRMLSWKAGLATGFACSAGKSGKYLYRFLPERDWNELLATYASARTEEIWKAVFVMCGLFDRVAAEVGAALHFSYNIEEAKASLGFLQHVRRLPATAAEIYRDSDC